MSQFSGKSMSSSTIATHSVLAFKTAFFLAMLSGRSVVIIICPAHGMCSTIPSKLSFGFSLVGITKSIMFASEHVGIVQ